MATRYATVDERISSKIKETSVYNSLFLATNVAGLNYVLRNEQGSFVRWIYPEGKKDE